MIETINVIGDSEEFDKLVNDFEKKPQNSVFATQTHVTQMQTSDGPRLLFTAVIFYKLRS